MKIGFTGSRNGMTEAQKSVLRVMVSLCDAGTWFHHGNCIGSDDEANQIAYSHHLNTVAHPSNIPSMQASSPSIITLSAKPPLIRNHDIVDETDVLIATPETSDEVMRSGTWATIRYARKQRKHIRIVLPDGTILTH